jgi:hypothetical protein
MCEGGWAKVLGLSTCNKYEKSKADTNGMHKISISEMGNHRHKYAITGLSAKAKRLDILLREISFVGNAKDVQHNKLANRKVDSEEVQYSNNWASIF